MATTLNLDISQELDITTRKGDSFSFTITVKDSDGDAVALTDYSLFHMDVRTSNDRTNRDNVVLSTGTSIYNAIISITGAADGTLTVSSTAASMDLVPEGSYLYDIQAIKNDGTSQQTWFAGTFTINADITDHIG